MSAPPRPGQLLPTGTRLGSVHVGVTATEPALAFWTRVLGLTVLDSGDDAIRLGAGGRELVVLHPGAASPVPQGHTGLYHLAIHLPSRKDLARAVGRLFALRYPNSPTDHLVTETTYLWDPDGNGVELTFETPERGEFVVLPDGRPVARARDGSLRSGRDPVDLESLFGELAEDDRLDEPLPDGARIGHVHLHVGDLDQTLGFYRDLIGFRQLTNSPARRMADTEVDGGVPHTLAMNSWAGVGAPPPPPGTAGLRHFTIEVPSGRGLQEIAGRLSDQGRTFDEVDGAIEVKDPSSNAFRVVERSPSPEEGR